MQIKIPYMDPNGMGLLDSIKDDMHDGKLF